MTTIDIFFTQYAQAFKHYDLERLGSCYRFPVTFDLPDGEQTVFSKEPTFNDNNQRLFLLYQSMSIRDFSFQIVNILRLSDDSCLVDVKWRFLDSDGHLRQRLDSKYRLRETPEGLKIVGLLLSSQPHHWTNELSS